jgi:hypothetical protein
MNHREHREHGGKPSSVLSVFSVVETKGYRFTVDMSAYRAPAA